MPPILYFITTLFSLGTLIVDIALVLLLVWYVLWRLVGGRDGGDSGVHTRGPFQPIVTWVGTNAVCLGLMVSALAVAGSLFFSNIVGFTPCELCWWQRIFIYPQVVIFALAAVYDRRGKPLGPVFSISGVLSLVSFLISAFQYYGATFNASALAACSATGVSCAKTYFVEFGYVTIPVMSLTVSVLLLGIVFARRFR